jgi:hypothetical protein
VAGHGVNRCTDRSCETKKAIFIYTCVFEVSDVGMKEVRAEKTKEAYFFLEITYNTDC